MIDCLVKRVDGGMDTCKKVTKAKRASHKNLQHSRNEKRKLNYISQKKKPKK